nr:hypothetical protein [Tanacetum cinerariifolium]
MGRKEINWFFGVRCLDSRSADMITGCKPTEGIGYFKSGINRFRSGFSIKCVADLAKEGSKGTLEWVNEKTKKGYEATKIKLMAKDTHEVSTHHDLHGIETMWISEQLAGNISECHALALSIQVTDIS